MTEMEIDEGLIVDDFTPFTHFLEKQQGKNEEPEQPEETDD